MTKKKKKKKGFSFKLYFKNDNRESETSMGDAKKTPNDFIALNIHCLWTDNYPLKDQTYYSNLFFTS